MSAKATAGGTLYVVATPIGNLGDVTLRALEVLKSVPLVAAEDTRMTRRLWARFDIKTRLVSYHAQSKPARLTELLDHLAGGKDLALVTDAGTPIVSDPGEQLVGEWVERGGRVVPIPGASAVLAALVASGVPAARWTFEGFLPRRGRERKDLLRRICGDERASVLFEAPGRAAATLADLALTCGASRRAALCRELTKLHEEIWRGTLAELSERAAAKPPRGEVTIVVAGADPTTSTAQVGANTATLEDGRLQVDQLVGEGWTRSSAAKDVAERTGLKRRDLFKPGR
jgi:16S rRNA (cytidine1402-2'-O)-methyltransferase